MILAIIGTILSFIAILGLFVCLTLESTNKHIPNIFGGTAIIGVILIVIGVITDFYNQKHTAIDVYQGKTTLEITYRDSIPVDSVVVYKEEFKK